MGKVWTRGQCTEVTGSTSTSVSWQTSFNWAGDSWQVKPYANAALKFNPVQIANVKSIPTTMEYKYTYEGNIITNVAYDLFTSSTPGGKTKYELMVWLATFGGAWPLSSTEEGMTLSGSGPD